MAAAEAQADTVAIPKTAIRVAAFLASSLLVGVGGVLWNNHNALISMDKDIEHLKLFGPGTGRRFTWDDWQDHKREFQELENEVDRLHRFLGDHRVQGAHIDADRRITQNLLAIQQLAIKVQNEMVAEK